MKQVQLFSLMGAFVGTAALLAGCGNSNQNPAALNYGYGTQTAAYTGTGYNTAGSVQTPLYSGNQIIGYKIRSPLFSGTYSNIAGALFSQSVQVNAGDQLSINMTNMQYGAMIRCHRTLLNTIDQKNGGSITDAVLSFNGQAIPSTPGSLYTAPSAGTITISADLSQLNGIKCGWNDNRSFDILSYYVILGNSASNYGSYYNSYSYGYGYGYGNNTYNQSTGGAVDIIRCTNTAGAAMACPY